MSREKREKSRKTTPWEVDAELTATQKFLKQHYASFYVERHRKVIDSGEADMINSYLPLKCPFCETEKFKKSGYTKSGIQRYMCSDCGKTFLPTTGTIFDEHKISISEWTEYCLNIFRHVSITADSWNNKNAFTTSRYWLQKLFLTLEQSQEHIVLSGKVWFDETFYTVRSENIVRKDNGDKLRGLSQNQICIGVATDKRHIILLVEGTGKPSQKKTVEAFRNRIEKGATLYHDEETAHRKLIEELSLKSKSFSSKELKGLPDKENPMNPVNRVHAILKKFLNAHSGFDRNELQNWLNLFAFITNPPNDFLEKVDLIVNLAFQNPKLLRYRDFYANNTGFDN
jgi:transposase-like protein